MSARIRAATRAMLLETARELIEHNGEAALTLSAVADEAGLAHATIYGYFSGKRDLLAALGPVQATPKAPAELNAPASEPVNERATPVWIDRPEPAALSQPVVSGESPAARPEVIHRDVESTPQLTAAIETVAVEEVSTSTEQKPVENDEPVDAPCIAEPAALEELPVEGCAVEQATQDHAQTSEHTPQIGSANEAPAVAEVAEAESDSELLTPFERERHLQATHLEEIAKRLILPASALKQGTDAVISRLETRMKLLERSIASLESRHNAFAGESDRKLKPVSDLVTQLQTRADAAEDRLRQALAELRLHIHELKARQDTLDGGSRSAVAEMPVWPEPVVDVAPQPAEEPEPATAIETSEENSKLAYLSAVRNSAKEGARQAAERESAEEEEQNTRRRRLLAAAGVAVACLAVVGVLFRFHPGSHGVSAAQSKAVAPVTMHTASHRLKEINSRAPLDRLTALANKGNAKAELVIGLKYLKGDGISANDAQAARWLERAAQSGDPIAENHLGALYQTGRGVKADVKQAIHWYEMAAAQGDRHAMSNLAVLYAGGAGAITNFAEAARWFQRSASLGYVDAQFNLAVLFERGDGVPQSLLDAYKWYSIAAAAGDAVAKTRAEAIATQVSPEELQAAQLAVASFKPQPMNGAANDEPTMAQVLAGR